MRKALVTSAALEPIAVEPDKNRYQKRQARKKADKSVLRYGCPKCGEVVANLPGWFPRKQPEMAQRTLDAAWERHVAMSGGCRR